MIRMGQVVHFGAGNIGRGFIGALFSNSGYHVTFIDMADHIIQQLNENHQYEVIFASNQRERTIVKHVSGLNNMLQEDEVIKAIVEATFLTTAIGPTILPKIAPLVAKGLEQRIKKSDEPLYVIACENQIGATRLFKEQLKEYLDAHVINKLDDSVYFLNSAVDRIVPIQNNEGSLDVLVEPYHEWIVETNVDVPEVEGMKTVPNLAPYIERKLFTVNTGHATTAYVGYLHNKSTIDEALADATIELQVRATLNETGQYLIKKFQLDEDEHRQYIDTIIQRFKNPYLKDRVTRVGRAPIRKLGSEERFVKPANALHDCGLPYEHLAKAVAAALQFDIENDTEAIQLQKMIEEIGLLPTLKEISGLDENSAIAQEVMKQYLVSKNG